MMSVQANEGLGTASEGCSTKFGYVQRDANQRPKRLGTLGCVHMGREQWAVAALSSKMSSSWIVDVVELVQGRSWIYKCRVKGRPPVLTRQQ